MLQLQLGCTALFPPALRQQKPASFSRDKTFLLKSLYNLAAKTLQKRPRDLRRRGGTGFRPEETIPQYPKLPPSPLI